MISLEGNSAAGLMLVETGVGAAPSAPISAVDTDYQPAVVAPFAVQSLGELFATVAAEQGDAPAVTTTTRQWSYAQLLGAARAVAAKIEAHSAFAAGGRVVLLLSNSAEYA